jgi:transcription elongation factor/antiterminator RfaH
MVDIGKEMELASGERWFLVYTLPASEGRAQMHLGAQGFRTFYPQIVKTVRHARQLRTVRAPFFQRYLFVILNLNRDRWLSIRSTYGVADLFTSDNRPVAVPHGMVEDLIERTANGTVSTRQDFIRGQRVQIISGPLAGFVGTLDRLDEQGRVRLLLEMMSSAVPVVIDRFRLLPLT